MAGGRDNSATGLHATVPGGTSNTAAGMASFAAGSNAAANHDGAFVWADSQAAPFQSSGPDQFLIRASGGVGIGTNTPTETLEVAGTVAADRFLGDGSGLSGVSRVGSTVDLDNVALLRWDLLNRSFPVGDGPWGVAFDGANIWVADDFSDNVTRISLVK